MPGGIVLLESDPTDIITPPAGKDTIFIDATATPNPAPAYKDSSDVTHSLIGPIGIQGLQGIPGFGGIDGEDGDCFIALPGAQGNPGPTGSIGPVGPMMVPDDHVIEDVILSNPSPQASGSVGVVGPVLSASITITDAQYRVLNATPLVIVTAQGVGTVILPVMFWIAANVTTGFSASTSCNVRYVTGATSSGMAAITPPYNGVTKRFSGSAFYPGTSIVATNVENSAMEVFNASGITSGVTSAGIKFTLLYQVLTFP